MLHGARHLPHSKPAPRGAMITDERTHAMTEKQNAAEPRPAATVLLLRDQPSFQVLMVKRHHQIDFASGALVFPGGKTHAGDTDERWSEHAVGWDRFDPVQRTLRIGAIREAFEEAGILIAEHEDGRQFADACDPSVRSAVDKGELDFLSVVKGLGVKLQLDALSVFARWITPAMMPKRFDTWFYAIHAPKDQIAACDGRETVDAQWIEPAEAVRLGTAGERTIIFPTLMNLRLLAEASDAADCIRRAQGRRLVTVLPTMEERNGERHLVIPSDAGYGEVSQPVGALASAMKSG